MEPALRLEHMPPRGLTVYTDVPATARFDGVGVEVSRPCNAVMRIRTASLDLAEQRGPLSIRCAFGGRRLYAVDSARYAVDDRGYLLLNAGQVYSSHIRAREEVESFHICFWPSAVEEVLGSLITPADRLLDDPRSVRQPVVFVERLYPHDEIVSPVIHEIRDALSREWLSHEWLNERNRMLLQRMLHVHRGVGREIEALPPVRHATRVELYQRLHRARDFMDASFDRPITLADIAEVAWLSPHHFLRSFKQVYHETPHGYLTRRRLETARSLLERTNDSVTEICASVGFASIGSFISLFRRSHGLSPERYRKALRERPSCV